MNILTIIVILAIIFCLYSFVSLKVLSKDYVNFFGYTFFQVATGSMTGTIEVGDAVVVKITDEYQLGDIVTYQSGDDFITHRIIEETDDYIIAKGDANNTNDNPIDKSLVLGKVVQIIPKVGVWKDTLLTPKVIILIFATLFMFSLLFAYNGKNIKIILGSTKENRFKSGSNVNDDELDLELRRSKRKNRPKKILEYTQVIDLKPLQNINVKKKKSLEYTRVIDLAEIKNNINGDNHDK